MLAKAPARSTRSGRENVDTHPVDRTTVISALTAVHPPSFLSTEEEWCAHVTFAFQNSMLSHRLEDARQNYAGVPPAIDRKSINLLNVGGGRVMLRESLGRNYK